MDLSKVFMDDSLSSTLAGYTIPEESDDSTESEVDLKDDSVVLAQPAVDQPIIPLTPSANIQMLKIIQLKKPKTFPPRVTRPLKTP